MEILAYKNWGRWIVNCPKCDRAIGSALAEPNPLEAAYSAVDGKFICPNCYPGMVLKQGMTITGQIKFNLTARAAARARADRNREVYDVVFPKERKQIDKALSLRPLDKQNWMPGETVGDLLKENEEHEVK